MKAVFHLPLSVVCAALLVMMSIPAYCRFTSSPHMNGYAASIEMTYDDNGKIGTKTPDTLLTEMEHIQITSQKDHVVSPVEHGSINGLPAIRQKYQFEMSSGLFVSGCYYVITNEHGCIVVSIDDLKPFCDSTLPRLDTSIEYEYPDYSRLKVIVSRQPSIRIFS